MATLQPSLLDRLPASANRDSLIDDGRRQLSSDALRADVTALADCLLALGSHRIALLADNGIPWIVADLACQQAGVTLLPVPTFFTPAQMQHALDEAGVELMLTDAAGLLARELSPAGQAPTGWQPVICPTAGLTLLRRTTQHRPSLPDDSGKITYTSGSTGNPKGVCLSNPQLITQAEALAQAVALPNAKHLCLLPLSVLLENIAGVYTALVSGGSVIVPPLEEVGLSGSSSLDVPALLAALHRFNPNTLILLPQMLMALVAACDQGWQPPASLKFIAVGGSKVAPELLAQARRHGLPVYEGYGLSECASVVSLNTPTADRLGSAGKPLRHLTVTLDSGEVMIAGNPFLGYVNDPASWHPQRIASGDLGRLDEDGFLHLEGRRKNLLITSFGRNISPEWVESELAASPLLRDVVVVGDSRPWLAALIHPRDPHLRDAAIDHWVKEVNSRLPDYARIGRWLRLDQPLAAIPGLTTATGKPRREAIQHHFQQNIDQLYGESPMIKPTFFQQLTDATTTERQHLLGAPLISRALNRQITLEEYVAFLTQAYHHVKHTVPLLMAAGSRIPDSKEWLREAVAEYIEEEIGHQEWILNDIAACGFDKEQARRSAPSAATELMVAYAYDMIQRVNPIGFFGMVYVLEGTSTTVATQAAGAIKAHLGLPANAFSYLNSHGALDIEHMGFFEGLMNRVDDPADQAQIIHCARMFFRLYGDIFRTLPQPDFIHRAA